MSKDITIRIEQIDVSVKEVNQQSYISLTDIARAKSDEPKDVIANLMRLKNTIQLLGFWELRHNPDFKRVEFEAFKIVETLQCNVSTFCHTPITNWRHEIIYIMFSYKKIRLLGNRY